jgi:uncharacterized membrane protein
MKNATCNHITFIIMSSFLVMISACQKNDSTAKTAFTNASVKPIFDTKCATCHAASGSNSGSWLYDPADYNASIKNSIQKIYETVYIKKTMPQGSSLSASELQAFKSWYDAGYPSN